MSEANVHATLAAIKEHFFNAWSEGDWANLSAHLDANSQLLSSQHGEAQGEVAWKQLLANDASHCVWMRSSNHAVVVGENQHAAASAYIIGLFQQGQQQFLFGACTTLDFHFDTTKTWLIDSVKIQVMWCKGDLTLAKHWRAPPSDSGWKLGDAPPVIVSELDSPWAKIKKELPQPTIEDAISQLYSKYSWAIDQGDIALLSDTYSEDVAGGFSPMGQLQGRHAIIGQQKSFRRLWPWMQHFADVLRIELDDDGKHACMIVGRIIPERAYDEVGHALYGAHYQLQLRLEDDQQWRICWFDYRSGWFNIQNIPQFEIGITQA